MKMSKKKISLLLLIFISLLLINTNTVRADGVWEYSFDDGDSLDDWDITYGNWTVDDGSLLATDQCENATSYEACISAIWHEQTSMTGNWSFDVLLSGQEKFGMLFFFIGNGVQENVPDYNPIQAYVIHLWHDYRIDLDYVSFGSWQYYIDQYIPSSNLTGWIHFEITRDQDNEMVVYLNGSEIMRKTNSLISTSEYLHIQAEAGMRFDNFKFPKSQTISGYGILPLFICTVGVIIVYMKMQKSK